MKALACVQNGVHAIGLNGVWCSAAKNDKGKFLLREELQKFDWRGRKVYIGFDADAAINPDVRHALIRLFCLLSVAGAHVYQLTSWDVEQGKGIDDFLVNESKDGTEPSDTLTMLMEDASPFVETIKKDKIDLDAIASELEAVHFPQLFRVQFCKAIAPKLGLSVDNLKKIGVNHEGGTVAFDDSLEPWGESVDGPDLLRELSVLLQRHIVLSDNATTATALWIILSYLDAHVDVLPILGITSPQKRCGKTRLLSLIGKLAHRTLSAANVSAPAIYRSIEKWHPTLLIDEADTFLKNDMELRGVLNSGHTRDTAFVLRCVGENKDDVKRFSTWCPKSIALIGSLPDTLADRAIHIEMERRRKDGPSVAPLRKTPEAEFETLRRKLLRWALDHGDAVEAREPEMPSHLNDRAADNWTPLVAIAGEVEGVWPGLVTTAMCGINDVLEDDNPAIPVLVALKQLYEQRGKTEAEDYLKNTDIVQSLNEDKEAIWAKWNKGAGMEVGDLTKTLKPFKVKSHQHAPSAEEKRTRGWFRYGDLKPVFDRYAPEDVGTSETPGDPDVHTHS
jgi:hypothetical protein